jgi:phosphoribosylformimino-5-aminoimidazole carboxamide ribotide isomerase
LPFELIGVIDLRAGLAVHARGGRRDRYEPVAAVHGDAVALASHDTTRLGVPSLYVADLDAIECGAPQDALVGRIVAIGAPVWLDRGVRSVDDCRHAIEVGPARIVVGLETLPSFPVLDAICRDIGRERVALSLDLRDGLPLVADESTIDASVIDIAQRAMDAGVGAVIVLDVARVGMNTGVDVDLVAQIRRATPGLPLFAGGGVRDWNDVVSLANAGCTGALVATALQTGALTAADVAAARDL